MLNESALPLPLLAERLVSAVERRDADDFAELFAEQAVADHPLSDEPLRGREEIRASERALFEAFSGVAVDVRSVLAADARCALEVVLRARNTGPLEMGPENSLPATGRIIEIPATWWFDVGNDGLIVESRDYFDTAAFAAQLGLSGE